MSILPTWPIAAGAAVLAFAAGFGIEHTRLGAQIAELQRDHATEAAQREQVRAADERAARETEQKLLQEAAFALETKQNEIADINSRAADLAERLRQRPARASSPGGMPASRAACAGATGAELSAEDGIFLAGEAARADTLRAALAQCYRQYQTLTQAQ
jgi:hypothetical protein